ncbi:hypothetical protein CAUPRSCDRAFT_13012 [Caulochytrium protostelioides]|nr:hypothetical protein CAUPRSCDRAFT_13012 [Caulochytrium protostelioides]
MSAEAAVKIDKAYTLLQRVDHVAGVVPSLVARLHSLERLHNEAGVFAESLGQLQAVAAEGDAADAALQTTLETLRSSMAENDRRTRENMALLEQRLEKLRQHVDPS